MSITNNTTFVVTDEQVKTFAAAIERLAVSIERLAATQEPKFGEGGVSMPYICVSCRQPQHYGGRG